MHYFTIESANQQYFLSNILNCNGRCYNDVKQISKKRWPIEAICVKVKLLKTNSKAGTLYSPCIQ